jgi:APA family basic amino acid/polyamine antiporter
MVVSYLGASGASVFNTLVLMTGITAAIPYGFSALAQLRWRLADRRAMHGARIARDATVAVVALVFSVLFILYSRNTAEHAWYLVWGPFLMAGAALALGIPVYLSTRHRMTTPPPVPDYR